MNSDQFHNVVEAVARAVERRRCQHWRQCRTLAEFFQVAQTSSGYVVSDQTAMSIATVYRCVGIIGGAISQLPLHHFRQAGRNAEEAAEDAALVAAERVPD